MGYSVEVLDEDDGLSGQGTPDGQLYSGDVLRKLLGKLEQQARVTAQDRATALQGGAAVKVRERASRRDRPRAGQHPFHHPADEPTGNLDSKTSVEIMNLLERLHERGNTIIVVTHEPDIAAHAHRVLTILDGQISKDERTR